jgi:hypothetical protein
MQGSERQPYYNSEDKQLSVKNGILNMFSSGCKNNSSFLGSICDVTKRLQYGRKEENAFE